VPRAGKHKTGAKRGKTYNRCQAREIMQSVPSAGKHATGAERGKLCNRCQARETMKPVPSAGNMYCTSHRAREMRVQVKAKFGVLLNPDWLKNSKGKEGRILTFK